MVTMQKESSLAKVRSTVGKGQGHYHKCQEEPLSFVMIFGTINPTLRSPQKVGWSDFHFFPIFEKEHIAVDQLHFLGSISKHQTKEHILFQAKSLKIINKKHSFWPFQGNSQNYQRPCAKPNSNISKKKFGFGVFEQFGTTQ